MSAIRTVLVASDAGAARGISDVLSAEGCAVELAFDSGISGRFDFLVAERPPREAEIESLCRGLAGGGEEVAILTFERGPAGRWIVAARLDTPASMDLLARVAIALHRLRSIGRPPARSVAFGDVEVDFERGSARKAGRSVSLRAKESELLRRLVDGSPAVIPRDELLRTVWAYQDGVTTRTVDVHMSGLRGKLEDDPRRPRHLRTVRGVGYRFVA
jgi:transcriptional regulator